MSKAVIIGAGVGGLSAATRLAGAGFEVTVLEAAPAPGGKMRSVLVDGRPIDSGPTVFTMRWVFDQLFDAAGTSLEQELSVVPAEILARHAWGPEQRLDLFADQARTADAIARFSGPEEARRFHVFCEHARHIYQTLEGSFIRAQRSSPVGLARSAGITGMCGLLRIKPFQTLWRALGDHFRDQRLRQLFARYATYCGSSPFLAPATLMLVADVEQQGVWLVKGGMRELAQTLAGLAERCGATLRYGERATAIVVRRGRAVGVRLESGEELAADVVVSNADVAALPAGAFGRQAVMATPKVKFGARSLSALTWSIVAETRGFPLTHHNVFFSNNYAAEFDDLFTRHRVPAAPTVYVCAQDRAASDQGRAPEGAERLFCLVNAPPIGDRHHFAAREIEQCEQRSFRFLEQCGLQIDRRPEAMIVTSPNDFERMFPATGGALYGQASHGWQASFTRPGSRSKLPGLYLAGGSTHPGPGVPMATLSGLLATEQILKDHASIKRFHRVAMPGGISTD